MGWQRTTINRKGSTPDGYRRHWVSWHSRVTPPSRVHVMGRLESAVQKTLCTTW